MPMSRSVTSVGARPLAALALVALLGAAASCAGSSDAKTPTADDSTTTVSSTSTAGPRSTTEPAADPEGEVRARYLQITKRYYERLQKPDPADPTIAEDYVGASLDGVVARVQKLQSASQLDRPGPSGFPEPSVSRIELQGDLATVHSCLVDDVVVVDSATGLPVNSDVFTQTLSTTLRRTDEVWKISDQTLLKEESGSVGCDQ